MSILKKIKMILAPYKALESAERYIDYMEDELRMTRDAFDSSFEKNGILKNKNDRLTVQMESLRRTTESLRERLYSNGATQREIDFLSSCEDIYKNGKMISELRFKAMVAAMIEERQGACLYRNRTSGVAHAESHAGGLPQS